MDEQYQPGSTSCTAPGLLSKEGVLRLRCPVKLYDGINTIHASRKPTGSSKLQLLEAHAGYTALLGRRELQKTTTHTVTSQQPAALATVSAPHLVQSVQHPVVNSVLYPSNRVVAYSIGAEREHNVAVLAMEKRLAQLNQDLAESKSLVARQHQRLQDVEVAYKQMLLDVEVRCCYCQQSEGPGFGTSSTAAWQVSSASCWKNLGCCSMGLCGASGIGYDRR